MTGGYDISTDPSRLDIAAIHDFLSNRSYWAKGRTMQAVQKAIENSLCFGIYGPRDHFAGFARVVTDYTIFAYLMDLFVLEKYRKQGVGKQLMDAIVNHPMLQDIRFWRLDTKDAHGLYQQYGFQNPIFPEKIMERR